MLEDRQVRESVFAQMPLLLDVAYDPALIAHVDGRSALPPAVELPTEIRERCAELELRLSAAIEEKASRVADVSSAASRPPTPNV